MAIRINSLAKIKVFFGEYPRCLTPSNVQRGEPSQKLPRKQHVPEAGDTSSAYRLQCLFIWVPLDADMMIWNKKHGDC